MNRRSFITAIPAAVAALTASRSLAGATSPVAASEAIVGASEDTNRRLMTALVEHIESEHADLVAEWQFSSREFVCGETEPEIAYFPNGDVAFMYDGYQVPPASYVQPAKVVVPDEYSKINIMAAVHSDQEIIAAICEAIWEAADDAWLGVE